MELKSFSFNKGEYLYSYDFFDGADVVKISTSELAKDSLSESVAKLADSLKELFELPECVVIVNTVKFTGGLRRTITIQFSVEYVKGVISNMVVPIKPIGAYGDSLPSGIPETISALSAVYTEMCAYVRGDRAEQELLFDKSEDDAEERAPESSVTDLSSFSLFDDTED